MSSIMTSLIDLPEEVLIIIIKKLDTKSVYNLYKTCGTLKNIIVMQGVIRRCVLSCNSLAATNSLQFDMIKSISKHVYELNMSGVSNLTKSVLLPALRRMKCLVTLDVSYTEISIFDMVDVYTSCSTIENLTINCGKKSPPLSRVPVGGDLTYLQEVFKNFKNMHFVMKTMCLNLPYFLLRKSSLDTLKFTLHNSGSSQYEEEVELTCPFKHYCVFVVNHGPSHLTWSRLVPNVKMESIEYIYLVYADKYSINTSPLFIDFFEQNFNITTYFRFHEDREMCGVVAIFLWDKETTVFDENFFSDLKLRIREILASEIKITNDLPLPLAIDRFHYNWFHIYPSEGHRNEYNFNETNSKRRRIAHCDYVLNFDNLFNSREDKKMTIFFTCPMNATLSSSYTYLRQLTYLSLKGAFVRYSNDFFNVVFRCCVKLITLNVESSSVSNCSSFIMRSIPLSQSLKNIRLVDKRIDFTTLFSCFTQCKTLENICVIDRSDQLNNLADLGALYRCLNLYSLHIHAAITSSTMTAMMYMSRMLLKSCPDHVNFCLENSRSDSPHKYNPYLKLFNVSPIKPV